MTILFLQGVNDLNQINLGINEKEQMKFVIDGCCNIQNHLQLKDDEAPAILLFGKKTKQPSFHLPELPRVIFNEISDPDSHQGSLERCVEVCKQIPAPVINRPEQIQRTTRDQVSRTLRDIPGVIMPKTIRCQPRAPEDVFSMAESAAIDFPFIVRIAGVHGGKSSTLVAGKEDFEKLHVYPFDGSWFYLTEFVDYKSSDGLYKKIRIVVVDGKPLLRHLLMNKQWMIHASSRKFMDEEPELEEEHEKFLAAFESDLVPKIQSRIDEIHKKLGLEYFGIDCNINEQGEVLIFEANANMNVFYNTREELQVYVDRIKSHVRQLINDKSSINI